MMAIMNLFVLIVVFGVVMWLVNAYIPMTKAIKSLLNILVLIVLVLLILEFFNLIPPVIPFVHLLR